MDGEKGDIPSKGAKAASGCYGTKSGGPAGTERRGHADWGAGASPPQGPAHSPQLPGLPHMEGLILCPETGRLIGRIYQDLLKFAPRSDDSV